MGWGGGAAGGRAAAAISSRISSKPPTRQPLPGGAPAVGAGVGQDGEWHRGPHPANPRARMRPPNPGRSGRREWASGKERRAARSPGSPASLRHRSRVFPQFEGIPCPSGAPREWPHPGIRPSPLVLSGPLFQSVSTCGGLGGGVWHCCSKPSPEMAGLGSALGLSENLGFSLSSQIFLHRRLACGGLGFQAARSPVSARFSKVPKLTPPLPTHHLGPI